MFKEKNERKKKIVKQHNFDEAFNKQIQEFNEERNKIQDYKTQLVNIENNIKKLSAKKQFTQKDFAELSRLKTEKEDIQLYIEDIENFKMESNYFLTAQTLINEKIYIAPTQKMTINEYFLYSHDNENKNIRKNLTCSECNNEMFLDANNIFVCNSCGNTDISVVEQDQKYQMNFLSNIETQRCSVYQRKNHFKEWLNQIQGRESNEVPQEVIDMIIVELNKIHYDNLANLDPNCVRKILKKLNLSKYYENIYNIINRINGLPPPILSKETEDRLMRLFKMIEEPFEIYKSDERKNILRYSYILYKLCELLELDDFLKCFKLLKNRNKLIQQDQIWNKICEHNKWQYIPSI